MYGWRARIGLMIIHANTNLECEFNLLKPEGVSIHAGRVHLDAIESKSLLKARSQFDVALKSLSSIDASSYILAATAATFVGGSEYDKQAMADIKEMTNGRPFTTAAQAVVSALRAIGAKRIAVGTSYSDELSDRLRKFLTEHGFIIENMVNYSTVTFEKKPPLTHGVTGMTGLQPPYFAYKLGRLAYVPGVDAVYLGPAGLRTIDVVQALETDLGVPVITSSQASVWAGLRSAGVGEHIPGYGKLLNGVPWSGPVVDYSR